MALPVPDLTASLDTIETLRPRTGMAGLSKQTSLRALNYFPDRHLRIDPYIGVELRYDFRVHESQAFLDWGRIEHVKRGVCQFTQYIASRIAFYFCDIVRNNLVHYLQDCAQWHDTALFCLLAIRSLNPEMIPSTTLFLLLDSATVALLVMW